ncbi:DNA protecting protein DprA [Vibrio sp. UCD-FRSSP16_10]|uniref:DNA-processing protein DprA n=1 Tax=unclassified Vibrio TaxID=2614977 RepID=UPI00080242E0|nr:MULTISPECIES: DNA-processing protein DprA [unclassified Vibrio]OBT15651.1 DNA protecting protein DprA [Vibrio sp. UCD-FRSSP16_30]OBT21061.1 DNA protecting protein DprA [Vibrio sp. UCD-FRSSP16_10]
MTEQQIIAWLTLALTPRLSGVKLHKILEFISVQELVVLSKKELLGLNFTDVQVSHLTAQLPANVERCLEWNNKDGNHLLICEDSENYPSLLKEIPSYPPLLFVQGNVSALNRTQIGVVGSRNSSQDGLYITRQFSAELTKLGITITSGLALGVDGHAHQACIEQGGVTVAVLGSGFDCIYPKQHKGLAERIKETGALVSEFPPFYPPKTYNFPRRNRVISGLSVGVLVVEAAAKSGSLITARFALEQGRDVYAVPGSVLNPNAAGCNALIRDGAVLVQNSQDIIQEMSGLVNWSLATQQEMTLNTQSTEDSAAKSRDELDSKQGLLNLLGDIPIAVDFLSERTHIPVNQVMMQLLELELKGLVASVSGGYIRLRGI